MSLKHLLLKSISNCANLIGAEINFANKLPKANLQSLFHLTTKSGLTVNKIFDIGANRAGWSSEAAKFYPNAEFTLVEPLHEMEPFINSFLNKRSNSQLIKGCIGSAACKREFVVTENFVSSSLYIPVEHSSKEQVRVVDVFTLDDLISIRGLPDIIKIDAEGAEFEILNGGVMFRKCELILLELPFFSIQPNVPIFSEMVTYMSKIGFEPYHFTWFAPRPHDGAMALCELAFAKRDGFLRCFQGW